MRAQREIKVRYFNQLNIVKNLNYKIVTVGPCLGECMDRDGIKRRFVLYDRNREVVDVYRTVFVDDGYEAIVAVSLRECLEKVREFESQCVLVCEVDHSATTVRFLDEVFRLAAKPSSIVLTSLYMHPAVLEFFPRTAYEYVFLLKPFSIDDLYARIGIERSRR